MLCLAALALLCWPVPAARRLRPVLSMATGGGGLGREQVGRDGIGRGGAGRGGLGREGSNRGGVGIRRRLAGWRRRAGRPGWAPAVLAVGAVALPAGPVAAGAAVLMAGTVAALTAAGLRRRRERRQIGLLLVATRTLAREVRAGAGPVTAVLATAAAHPGCAAALDHLAGTVGRGGGSRRAATESPSAGPGGGDRAHCQAEIIRRLGDGWELSARYGVPWAVLIETVATDLADRQRADAVRAAQVAGPRVSGYVLAVMPALGILLGAGMGADPVHVLLHTGIGAGLLLVGTVLTCLGLAWTASIVRS